MVPGKSKMQIGTDKGEVKTANVSTGRFIQNGSCNVGGRVLCLTSDAHGKIFWAGNDQGGIVSMLCSVDGTLQRMKRLQLSEHCNITSINFRAWMSNDFKQPSLLINCTSSCLLLFKVIDKKGSLQLARKFTNMHRKHMIRSVFCPIISFRQAACVVVTGSEDNCVYFIDVEKPTNRAVRNILQGHGNPVLGVSLNYDESFLATSDFMGRVVVWRKQSKL